MTYRIAMLAVALLATSSGPAAAAVCKDGETRFKNSVFYTCTCNTGSDGKTTCYWKPD